MIFLFDQAPRHIITGVDTRYTNNYPRPLALRLFKQCLALPAHLRPWRLERWESQGWNFEHWATRQSFFDRPLTHSEDIDNHGLQHGLHENLRSFVERHVGNANPIRATAYEDTRDTMLFGELIRAGPPKGLEVSMEEYVWWSSRIMDAHMPILRVFEIFPYDVAYRGEEYTTNEKVYLERTGWFHVPELDERELQTTKQDIKSGEWPPLKEQ